MKQVIKLTEADIQNMVNEAVNRMLNESTDEGFGDFLKYGAHRAGQKAQQYGKSIGNSIRNAYNTGKEAAHNMVQNVNQGYQNAKSFSDSMNDQRNAVKNQKLVGKYIQDLNQMKQSGLFNGISFGKRAIQAINDLITILNKVSNSGYGAQATAYQNQADSLYAE